MPFDANPITSPALPLTHNEAIMLLRRARERLKVHGLCKMYEEHDGRYCALGTLMADAERRTIETAKAALYQALPWQYRWHPWPRAWNNLSRAERRIAAYNDAPRRTEAEVLALYDKAIAIAVREQLSPQTVD